LAPLIVSVFLLAGFFVWEAQLPEEIAAMYIFYTESLSMILMKIMQSDKSLASEKLYGPYCWSFHYVIYVVWIRPALVLMDLAKCIWMVPDYHCPPFVSHFNVVDYIFMP
jgi:hypothetical protein